MLSKGEEQIKFMDMLVQATVYYPSKWVIFCGCYVVDVLYFFFFSTRITGCNVKHMCIIFLVSVIIFSWYIKVIS